MSEVTIRGDKIHYLEGDRLDISRLTLLFIHGAGQSAATWRFQHDAFGNNAGFNFIAPDLPGHGDSEGDGFTSISAYKDFVLDFIETLELGEVIIVGHSMGGMAAMLLAIEHPELLKACVLVATSAKLRVAQQTLELIKKDYPEFCNTSPTRAFAAEAPDALKLKYIKGLLNTKPEVCYQDLIACNEFDIINDVEKIGVPVLIVSAEKDIMTPPKNGEYLHHKIYGSEFHRIKGAGHFLIQEKADEFNSILLNHISDYIQ